ncbi:uncharacterized protein LOC122838566 isoform X2 [Gambusia affinis]|uniref:uncharacterized protein LOC122838566 isoform X2 n=1 Tax=Gambusia affinis TaxID=33528 RepID=UPI001CDD27E5|nr:uncharacterized protein LOC122838566 isoform X2 [Gambusia affinis]
MMCQTKFYRLPVLVVVLVLVSGLSSSQNLESKVNYSCFSCPFSEAESIDMVYDQNSGRGDFWYRNGSALTSCDFSSIYESKRKCSVCLNNSDGAETVVMVLCNLTSSEELLFEGQYGDISFNKTDCPQPEPIDTELNNDGGRGHVIFLGCFIAAVIIIIIFIIMWNCHKSQEVLQVSVDGSSCVSFDSGNGSALINTPGNGSVV